LSINSRLGGNGFFIAMAEYWRLLVEQWREGFMSSESAAHEVHESERLIRMISFAGFACLPVLILFVHLLLIYRT
jgi:hypothetical protein